MCLFPSWLKQVINAEFTALVWNIVSWDDHSLIRYHMGLFDFGRTGSFRKVSCAVPNSTIVEHCKSLLLGVAAVGSGGFHCHGLQ